MLVDGFIIMSVLQSKTIIIIILTCYGLLESSPCSYICALLLPALPSRLPILSTGLALLSFIPKLIEVEPKAIVLCFLTTVTHAAFHGVPCWRPHE